MVIFGFAIKKSLNTAHLEMYSNGKNIQDKKPEKSSHGTDSDKRKFGLQKDSYTTI